jgi:hypothetical protein
MWNLVPLCDGHHVADHLGLLKITGRAPFDLAFEWMSPPTKPALLPREIAMVIDDDVPAGTPGLDAALVNTRRGSSRRWAAAVGRVVTRVAERDAELPAGSTCASRRSDDVPGDARLATDEVAIASDVRTRTRTGSS